ncbi:hypothetical protein ACWA6H_00465 [Pseudomonas bijieensis]
MTKPLRYLSILYLVQAPLLAVAQDAAPSIHQKTTTPENARFEIVHSPLAAKWTFRLDRYTGNIGQLVKTASGGSAWDSMTVIGLPKVDGTSGPRFVLLTSGLAARFTFLMDTQSGRTWELTSISNGNAEPETVWQPFE